MAEQYQVIAKVISQKGTCSAGHKVGDGIDVGGLSPADMCPFAFCAVFPFTTVLQFGGAVPWDEYRDKTRVACPDAENPVVFELRRLRK